MSLASVKQRFFYCCCCLLIALPASASDGLEFITLTVENDIIAGDDGGYTNGIAVSWAKGDFAEFNDDNLPAWLNRLAQSTYIANMPDKRRAVSYLVGQGMQTTSDITVKERVLDEPSYAGLLLWRSTLHAFDSQLADRLSLTLGIVGPLSAAEPAQKTVHDITGSEDPQGWKYQLDNEPVFQFKALRNWRVAQGEILGREYDIITSGEAGIGNLQSALGLGVGFRWGRGLLRAFPSYSAMPGREVNALAGYKTISWQLFINLLGRYTFNDIAIDGNTFKDNSTVKLKHENAIVSWGVAFNVGNWGVLMSMARSSDLFQGQQEPNRFGSASLTYHF